MHRSTSHQLQTQWHGWTWPTKHFQRTNQHVLRKPENSFMGSLLRRDFKIITTRWLPCYHPQNLTVFFPEKRPKRTEKVGISLPLFQPSIFRGQILVSKECNLQNWRLAVFFSSARHALLQASEEVTRRRICVAWIKRCLKVEKPKVKFGFWWCRCF